MEIIYGVTNKFSTTLFIYINRISLFNLFRKIKYLDSGSGFILVSRVFQNLFGHSTVTTASLARLILKNHSTGSREFRQEYLDYLSDSSREFVSDLEQSSGSHGCSDQVRGEKDCHPVDMLNRIYRLLEPYAIELNRMVARSGFTITCTAPTFSHEEFEGQWPYKSSKMVQIYRCRFASMVLSANVRVKDNDIGFYLIPSEHAIRQSEAEEEVGPLMLFSSYGDTRFSRFGDSGRALWWVEGKPLTDDRFERYCLLFFDHFVKKSQKLALERLSEIKAD